MISTMFSPTREATFLKPAHILVATDLTDLQYLMPHAIAQAKGCGADLTFVHSIVPVNVYPTEAGYSTFPEPPDVDRNVRTVLARLNAAVKGEGISCNTFIEYGFAVDTICEKIKTIGATRLIMGSHGRGKWDQFVLGSVSNELLGSVSIPIFVVGPHVEVRAAHARPQRILHPVSFKGDYKQSFAIASGLAAWYQAELTLLHVEELDADKEKTSACTLAWAEAAMRSMFSTREEKRYPVQTRAVSGSVVKEILDSATKANADWIVLGVEGGHGYLPFRNNTAYKVIAGAKCGVLVVPHDVARTAEKTVYQMPSSVAVA
jgi:nucleotide-binding universal stress UspA family protein